MRILIALLALLMATAASAAPAAGAFDRSHASWDRLLAAHVEWNAAGTSTTVDYAGFKRERQVIERYLQDASAVDAAQFNRWSLAERQAFLINVYNAATVELVLTRYPGLKSIKDLGGLFGSPWKLQVLDLLGDRRSLDDIEHVLLRGADDYAEPRIHFAVNCASVGCPALRPEAYRGARLDDQLDDQTRRFLRDRNRNHPESSNAVLRVSKIFDWYAEDFESHSSSVSAFLARYRAELGLDAAAASRLKQGRIRIAYTPYDWSLNNKTR
ncbi:MAG: DUF547 domain-containing protein [Pseudomonadota bacterium]|nr:DUF547 domain-containing protein [Pseudomonadota bacterium]